MMKQITTFIILLFVAFSPRVAAQSKDRNYVLSRTFLDARNNNYMDAYQYLDDLGREEQLVQSRFTPNKKDLISSIQYDSIGRKWREYTPVASLGSNGNYLRDAFNYARTASGDPSPFQETEYEESPLNRMFSQTGAGHAWYEANRRKRQAYFINDADTSGILYARCYNVTPNYEIQPGISKFYRAGELKVILATGEDNDSILTFVDKEGYTILTRQRERGISHDTYYVYNDCRLLCYILPPMLEGRTDATLLPLYAYSYKYDYRDRCIEKKLPGCDTIYMIYDRSDRVVLQQDGNQRKRGRWTVLKYGRQGRMLYSYEHTDSTSLDTLRAEYAQILMYESPPERLSDLDPFKIGYTMMRCASGVDRQLLFANYYDDYAFLKTWDANTQQALAYVVKPGYAQAFNSAKDFQTGSCQALQDGSGRYLLSAFYYDEKGRVVQSHSMNIRGGYDHDYFSYSFTGKPLVHYHEQSDSTGTIIVSETNAYTYDHAERPVEAIHSLRNNAPVTLSRNWYDEQGRIQKKSLHNETQSYTYEYNIRNWLTEISGSSFTQHLYYQDGSSTPCYNGNISSMSWETGKEGIERAYHFSYDGLNRMTSALYGEGNMLKINSNRFSEQTTGYDKQGNILGLKRYGQTSASTFGMIDNLAMTYEGNQLKAVSDSVVGLAYNNGFEFKDNASQDLEYFYDSNGNLTKDLNKKITNIQYNCLNLPSRIEFEDGNTVSYLYSADGTKLQSTHVMGGVSTVTEYCGNVVYENGIAKLLLTQEGYVSLNDDVYHYFIQDHQGNNRVVIDQNGTMEETNHYYSFGGVFASSSSVQPYKYNGKELDTKNDLNWYDYGARHYDAAIGRWHVVDPMSEKYFAVSPYVYCQNNLVNMIDPKGLTDYSVNKYGYVYQTNPRWDAVKKFFGIKDNDDKLIAIDNNNATLSLPAGSVDVKDYRDEKGNVIGHFMNFSDNEQAGKVYDFLSENTGVEFSHIQFDDSKSTDNIISTSHSNDTEALGAILVDNLMSKGLNVSQLTHSHLDKSLPSGYEPGQFIGNDRDFVNHMDQKFPENNIVYRVYNVPNKRYVYYYKNIYKYENKRRK